MSDALDIVALLSLRVKRFHSMHPCRPLPMQQGRRLRQIQLIIKIETIEGKSRMATAAGGRFFMAEIVRYPGRFLSGILFLRITEGLSPAFDFQYGIMEILEAHNNFWTATASCRAAS